MRGIDQKVRKGCWHLVTSVPLSACAGGIWACDPVSGDWAAGAAVLADEVEAEESGGEPEDGREEGERNYGAY